MNMDTRNILLCTLGGSWAVVPEVFGFLAPDQLPLYDHHPQKQRLLEMLADYHLQSPTEVWICTTQGDRTAHEIELLLQWRDALAQPPVLRIWQAKGTHELVTREECDLLRELLVRACLLSHEYARKGQVVLSLAGGRKTMSADLQWAGHVFGCHALIHVVAQEKLPPSLRCPAPELFHQPLSNDLCMAITPFVTGKSHRSDLLDVNLDERGPITPARFPLTLPDDNESLLWSADHGDSLAKEIQDREAVGSQLLGNFILELTDREHHENWRGLYLLPPRVIDQLRTTRIDDSWRDWVRELPKADLHRHLGGCLDLADQRCVGQAVWADLSSAERHAARRHAAALLKEPLWPTQWPEQIRELTIPRTHVVAALLAEADTSCLERNLYDCTMPRVALKTCHTLGFAAYERPGELSGSGLLTHPAAIQPYAQLIVQQAVKEGLAYLELRGSPQKYGTGRAMAFLRDFRAALYKALATLSHPQSPHAQKPIIRFIIIVDRRDRDRPDEVVALAVQAKQEMPDFVVGLDLAGDEGAVCPEQVSHHFLPAFENCLPITIHAGEGESADLIWQAAYHLHADRIGHGLSISEREHLAARFRDRGICLELCPTSNREVVGFNDPHVPESADYPPYPLPTLWKMGLPLTVCTDNPGISRTTLADEYLTAARMAPDGLSCWDMLAMVKQAFVHAFLPIQEKEALTKRVDNYIHRAVIRKFTN